jgi:hypothetical protein
MAIIFAAPIVTTNAARLSRERVADLGGYIIRPSAAHRHGRRAR